MTHGLGIKKRLERSVICVQAVFIGYGGLLFFVDGYCGLATCFIATGDGECLSIALDGRLAGHPSVNWNRDAQVGFNADLCGFTDNSVLRELVAPFRDYGESAEPWCLNDCC